jgi:hypothetical protein
VCSGAICQTYFSRKGEDEESGGVVEKQDLCGFDVGSRTLGGEVYGLESRMVLIVIGDGTQNKKELDNEINEFMKWL